MRLSCILATWILPFALGSVVSPKARQAFDAQQTEAELTPLLSSEAEIVQPNDAEWTNLTERASYPRINPQYYIIVQVASEADVQTVVSYAYERDIPFLVVSGAHGWPTSLNTLQGGIQINMRKINFARVDYGGRTATVGGGALQYEVTQALFAEGKQTVTGVCECVSVIGPLLGGGHSFLQNQHGYALDNLVSARVVLYNGTVVEASDHNNTDLFWALRGAGHNFGVVTSYQMRLYDLTPSDTWTVYDWIFPESALEDLYSLVNTFEGPDRADKLMLNGVWARPPNSTTPVLIYRLSYEGTLNETAQYAAPFISLGPLNTTITTNVTYADLYVVTGTSVNSTVCKKNESHFGIPASLPEWDTVGIRQAFEIYRNATSDPRFATSVVLLENYGMNGIRRVDPASTALPIEERELPILVSPIMWYLGDSAQDLEDARVFAQGITDALYRGVDAAGGRRHTYVNYAFGGQSLEELYGYEAWRLERLRELKRAYDPYNVFSFYNPIS